MPMIDEVKASPTSLLHRQRPEFIFNLGAAWGVVDDGGALPTSVCELPMIGNRPEVNGERSGAN